MGLGQEFTLKGLLSFTFPTILMMLFMSTYSSVDGAFVSNFISADALAAVNIIYPVVNIMLALSLMLASGGNAIMGKNLGEGNTEFARRFLSTLYILGFIFGIILMVFALTCTDLLLEILGSTPRIDGYAREYLRVLILFAPMGFMQIYAQNFFITEGKPHLSLMSSFIGGITNIALDYIFIVKLDMGMTGAALATGIGYSVPAAIGFVFFCLNKKGILYFVKPVFRKKLLLDLFTNGSSELVNNLSIGITTLAFNKIMYILAGEEGISAITVILYIQFIQSAIYFGYCLGVSPVISFKYGAEDTEQLKKIVKISLWFVSICSVIVIGLTLLIGHIAVGLFLDKGTNIYDMALRGVRVFSASYIFMGVNVFLSSMFTALNNGKLSALLSFLRTFLFLMVCLFTLPFLFGVDGVWLSVPLAEAMAFVFGVFIYKKHSGLNYLP